MKRSLLGLALCGLTTVAAAQPIRLGELNSYDAQPVLLDAYRKGWKLALEEINATGGLLGRPVEVISRDDHANASDAVRVAEELLFRDHAVLIFGTRQSDVALAVADFAKRRKVLFLAAEPMSDRITGQSGKRYTFRLAPSTSMQVRMLVPTAAKFKRKRWALIYPDDEDGRSAAETFKRLLKATQPDAEFVAELATPTGRVDAGAWAQALSDARPNAIFNALVGPALKDFVREGGLRGLFDGLPVLSILAGWPEYLEPLRTDAPEGWLVTGYPAYGIATPEHGRFLQAYRARWQADPRMGSVIGYSAMQSIAAAIRRADSTDTERLVEAFRELSVSTPFGRIRYRAIDHQATLGAYVGSTTWRAGRGVLIHARYVDGAAVMPPDAQVLQGRP